VEIDTECSPVDKKIEGLQQMAARPSAGRNLGQLDEALIQVIYKYLPAPPSLGERTMN
jgi:hypothetical protein